MQAATNAAVCAESPVIPVPDAGSIIRRRMLPFERDYTMVPNVLLRERRLSLKAKGLLGYMLSHRDGFESGLEEIAGDSADGLAAVRSGMTELKSLGWVHVYRERDAKGKLRWVYELCEPSLALPLPVDNPPSKIELDRSVKHGNRTQVHAEIASTYGEKTIEKTKTRSTSSVQAVEAVENGGWPWIGHALPHELMFHVECATPGPHRVNRKVRNDLACVDCDAVPTPRLRAAQ